MARMLERMLLALNAHDIGAFVSLFAADYRSEQPAYPSRRFTGSDKVREKEPVDHTGAGIDDMVRETYRPPETAR